MSRKKLYLLVSFLVLLVSLIFFIRYVIGTWDFGCILHPCMDKPLAIPTLSVHVSESASRSDIYQLIEYVKSQHLQTGNDDTNVIASSHLFYIIGVPKDREDNLIMELNRIPSVEKVDKIETIE